MRHYENLDRQQIAAAYRDLVAENARLKPISKSADYVADKFMANPMGGRTDEDRAVMRRATEALEQRNANTEAMIEINNELAFRGEAKLSHEESGE